MEFIIGTTNKGKIREIASILSPLGFEMNTMHADVKETGKTIEDNAILKALGYSMLSDDKVVIVEDSGLVVPCLNGLPGVYSARFHSLSLDKDLKVTNVPEEDFTLDKTTHDSLNNDRLINLIKLLPYEKRAAYLEVCFVIAHKGKVLFKTSSRCNGYIITEPKGTNGFGYDPIFVGSDTYGKTFAELDSARKNLKSHRKKALRELGLFISNNFKN
ncbi:MAG: non-canonical purine NTP pyrophosphatase [Clostridia bacterium]